MKKVFLLCLFAAVSAFPMFAADHFTFTPAETDDIFANPGMGWQTFHRFADDDPTQVVSMGYLAQYVLDKRIPLEMCLTSNVDTGAVKKIEEHPFGTYYRYKFRVTLNTDDRLMSQTTMTKEFKLAQDVFGIKFEDIEKLTINAMKSAFQPYKERIRIIYNVIKPGYKEAREKLKAQKEKEKNARRK